MLPMRRRTVAVRRRHKGFSCGHTSCLLVSTSLLVIAFLLTIAWQLIHVLRVTASKGRLTVTSGDATTPSDSGTSVVTLCPDRLYGKHQTGNHLFMLAAMLYVSAKSGREVQMPDTGWILDATFRLENVRRFSGKNAAEALCPCDVLRPGNLFNVDPRFDNGDVVLRRRRTLALCGLYQTYHYADAVSPTLRQLLQFRPEILKEAELFMNSSEPEEWRSEVYVRVGVHIRRGDYLDGIKHGLTVVDEHYLHHAIDYFLRQYSRVLFFVATDDPKWATDKLRHWSTVLSGAVTVMAGGQSVAFALSVRHSTGVDLAMLSACDALIVSTGSFGWWAAWLANKTTVYYRRWPREGSIVERLLDRYGYFPDRWIPMV